MKAIKFSESELEFLQNHYELELLDAENYVGEIKNILKKLGMIEKAVIKEKPVKNSGKKAGRPKKEKKAVVENTAPLAKPEKKATAKKVVKKTRKAVKKAVPVKTGITPVVKAALKNPKTSSGAKSVKKKVKPAEKNVKSVAVAAPVKQEAPKPL